MKMDQAEIASNALRTLYIVQRLHWIYTDDYVGPHDDEPIRAFANKEAAEAYCRALEYNARDGNLEDSDENERALLPNYDYDFSRQFFEVVEVLAEP